MVVGEAILSGRKLRICPVLQAKLFQTISEKDGRARRLYLNPPFSHERWTDDYSAFGLMTSIKYAAELAVKKDKK